MQTGFVGLGAMGANMARNLHRAGLLTGRLESQSRKAKALAEELKVHAFANLTELAGNCEAVVTCVSAGQGFARSRCWDGAGPVSEHDHHGLLYNREHWTRCVTCTHK